MLDFNGEKLHFIQIGLGTNSTVIQNLAGKKEEYSKCIGWLLEPCSEKQPEHVRGIALEPVKDIVDALRHTAAAMPRVQLVHAAMGEREESDANLTCLSLKDRDKALEKVPADKRQKLQNELEYMRNMSCMGSELHPLIPMCRRHVESKYSIEVDVTQHKVDVWTWAKLVKTFNFVGCEVCLIDAEGCDTQILRSLLAHCRGNPFDWPDLIQFESMGHCDRREKHLGTEKEMIQTLEKDGYTLIAMSDHNTHLVRSTIMEDESETYSLLHKWVSGWYCYACWWQWRPPYVSTKGGIFCKKCFDYYVSAGAMKPMRMGVRMDDLSQPCQEWGEKAPVWIEKWRWNKYNRWHEKWNEDET